jgi:hypothetical protein
LYWLQSASGSKERELDAGGLKTKDIDVIDFFGVLYKEPIWKNNFYC